MERERKSNEVKYARKNGYSRGKMQRPARRIKRLVRPDCQRGGCVGTFRRNILRLPSWPATFCGTRMVARR
jgi:hypothetical protein